MPLPPRVGASDVYLSVTYIGPKSRTARPRNTKIGTEVALCANFSATCDSDTTFKVKRSTCRGRGILWRPPAQFVMFTTGSQDCSMRLWELSTGRCMRTLKFKFPVRDVAWNPNSSYSTVAAAVYVFCIL